MAEERVDPPFGVRLRQSRQEAALSLRQLAARVGYDYSYLSQVERGRRPGSAHLAQLCDRELDTGSTLATAFALHRPPHRPTPRPTHPPTHQTIHQPTHRPAAPRPSGRPPVELETVRHGLAGWLGRSSHDEWSSVAAARAAAFTTTPSADLLPDLTADLRALPEIAVARPEELAVPAAELAVLMALTVASLGRVRAAAEWWRTARTAVEGARRLQGDDSGITTRVYAAEAWSGPAEGRSLPEMLAVADAAVRCSESARPDDDAARPADRARALAARARVLALLNRSAETRQTLCVLREIAAGLDGPATPFDWPRYETDRVVGFVLTALGDSVPAWLALDRALAGCPRVYVRERAELELLGAECLVRDGEFVTGLSTAMRVLVELPDQWHTHYLYDVAGRVLAAVQGKDAGRPAVRDYRELLRRRPYGSRSVGGGSSTAPTQE
ncbi:helix-turn-helix protein [Kribbella amoyensis]|uniref:Helix-turn-helix protein n=1 Tax=Kribbella amoyensis TaxID=996641 RepID=A0A561B798_9ACTN|nr:helix-turn-helix transcriptional regulator [Kribbella amoyensis]TWD74854.1 helix-turn-helix protein [Kribbella amoyensis]